MCKENQKQNKEVRLSDEVLKQVTGGSQDRIQTLTCPVCTHPIPVTMIQLLQDRRLYCPYCGLVLTFD